jgi:hypothetical protein
VAVTLYATTSLVAVTWIATIPGLTASGVGNQLPAVENEWAAGGYVVVPVTVGGTPGNSGLIRHPVVQVECWATNPSSDKLPWGMAEQLAEQIRMGTADRNRFGRPLDLDVTAARLANEPGAVYGYPVAWVRSATMLTHPHRIWSDAGDYAGVTFNLGLTFVSSGEQIP